MMVCWLALLSAFWRWWWTTTAISCGATPGRCHPSIRAAFGFVPSRGRAQTPLLRRSSNSARTLSSLLAVGLTARSYAHGWWLRPASTETWGLGFASTAARRVTRAIRSAGASITSRRETVVVVFGTRRGFWTFEAALAVTLIGSSALGQWLEARGVGNIIRGSMGALFGLGVAALAWWWLGRHYPEGEGPFDHLPSGVTKGTRSAPSRVKASSGRSYDTYTWPPDSSGRQFHVAERPGAGAWISYWVDRATGARSLHMTRTPFAMGSASDLSEVAALRKDFGA